MRNAPIKRNVEKIAAWLDKSRRTSTLGRSTLAPGPTRKPMKPRTKAIRPMSAKRKKENKVRRAVCMEVFGPDAACKICGRPADHAHEIVPRSKGGSITDPANIIPACLRCHEWIHANPIEAKAAGYLA